MSSTRDLDTYRCFDHGLSYTTGLSDINPWAFRAMSRPYQHTGETFWRFYNETIEMIKEFIHTNAMLVPIIGPGRVVIDAIVNNFLEPGEKLLMVENGYWGRYPEVMEKTYGFRMIRLTCPVNRPINPDVVANKLREEEGIKVVHVAHVETEVGIINPVKKIGEIVSQVAPEALYVVDSATAFPGNKLDVDKWGIDVDYFVSHKGFNGPPGLNYMTVSDRALAAFNKRKTPPRGWYTSLQTWMDIWLENKSDGRHCMASFPVIILQAMRAKLDLMRQMGEEKYLKKYELASKAIRMGLRKMTEPEDMLMVGGPGCDGCPGCDAPDPNLTEDGSGRFCAQTDTCIAYPKGTDWKSIIEILEQRYWITCPHFGFGDERKDGYFYSGNGMRVGTINDRQHYPRNILAVISAIGFVLKEAGIKGVQWNKGVEATNEILKETKETLGWGFSE